MKFSYQTPCNCGATVSVNAYGDGDWNGAVCHACYSMVHVFDQLSVSVTAERLLGRSQAELVEGDYSLSIVIATMAIESFLTRSFIKLKGMNMLMENSDWPTPEEEIIWEEEYPRSGGFPKPADFVSSKLSGMTFDKFVAANPVAKATMSKFPEAANQSARDFFQKWLFVPRNRIAHWGYVNATEGEASRCLELAFAVVAIFREMDSAKYQPSKA
jgi:hypothetical protein